MLMYSIQVQRKSYRCQPPKPNHYYLEATNSKRYYRAEQFAVNNNHQEAKSALLGELKLLR